MALWLLRYFVLASFTRIAGQQGSQLLKVSNAAISLEAEMTAGPVGTNFVFYISFVDGLFTTGDSNFNVSMVFNSKTIVCVCTALDRVQNSRTLFKNVQTFVYLFETIGNYQVFVTPLLTNVPYTALTLYLNVYAPVDPACIDVGMFVIDNTAVSPFPDTTLLRKKLSDWTVISRLKRACPAWGSKKSGWSVEKMHMKIPQPGAISQCLNTHNIRQVDLDFYTSNTLHIPLSTAIKGYGFVIQPYMLPPGYYRICNTVSDYGIKLIHCAILALVPNPSDCKPFVNAMRIEMTPELEEVVSNLRDQNLTAKYYSVYALPEVGYIGQVNYTHKWTCSGDVLCKSLQQRQRVKPTAGDTYTNIELTGQGTEIFIPRWYQTTDTTVTFTFTVEYQDPLFAGIICSTSAERTITFKRAVYEGVSIRCYLNCWNLVNPEKPLLLGLSCYNCRINQASTPDILWTLTGMAFAQISGSRTQFFTVTNIHDTSTATFIVRVKIRYLGRDKNYYEILLGKHFKAAQHLPNNLITTVDLIKESQESSEVISGDLAESFQRFDLSSFELFNDVAKFIKNPIIITITVLHQDAEEDYVVLRSIWAPEDFCIESTSMLKQPQVRVQLSTTDGLTMINLKNSIVDLHNHDGVLGPNPDIEQLWLLTKDSDSFTVNGLTVLGVITQAIIETASSLNIGPISEEGNQTVYMTSAMPFLPLLESDDQKYLQFDNTTFSNWSDLINESLSFNLSAASAIDSKKLLEIIEMVLDDMISYAQSQLTYSDIDLFFVSLVRMLSIQECSIPVLAKSINVFEKVHALHRTVVQDSASDDETIRQKLKALHAITAYYLECRASNPQSNPFSAAVFNSIADVTYDIPQRISLRYPAEKTIGSKEVKVKALWLNPFQEKNDLSFDLSFVKLIITMEGLRSANFRYSMNTFLNVAVYADEIYLMRDWTGFGTWLDAPLLYISITMKQPVPQHIFINTPEIFQFTYDYNFSSTITADKSLKFGLYATKQLVNRITDSDCYFFKVEAISSFASVLSFKSKSNLKLSVKVQLSNLLSHGLQAVISDEIILPHSKSSTMPCAGVFSQPYSVYLPALTLRQQAKLKGKADYYVILKVKRNQPFATRSVKSGPDELVEIGEEIIDVKCLKASCVRWTGSYITATHCYITTCSGGVPQRISCRCNSGSTFTAGTGPCRASRFTIIKRSEIQWKTIDFTKDVSFIIPTFIVASWIIFLAILSIVRRKDVQEIPLGKTYAIEGVYSPFRSNLYLMCIVTGFGRGSGTMSIPYMTVIGTHGVSVRYELKTSHCVFVTRSEIWLLISLPYDLGQIERVVLSLEPKDKQLSSWNVDKVFIKRLISGQEWTCFFNAWIPDKDNHSLLFIVADSVPSGEDGGDMFISILKRLIRNQHPMFGIFYNIPGSNFSKTQHLLFSFCGLFFLMWICLLAHDVPTPKLITDPVLKEIFSLTTELYARAMYCAMIAVLPVFLLGILLESAKSTNTRTVEWRTVIKHRDNRPSQETLVVSKLSDEETLGSESSLAQKGSPVDPYEFTIVVTETTIRRRSALGHPSTAIEPTILSHYVKLRKMKSRNKFVKAAEYIAPVFQLPVQVYLILMVIVIVTISHYILILGFYFSDASSLEYLYIVIVAFIMLMVLWYPLLLIIVAVINTLMYVSGMWYYGARVECESRTENVCKILRSTIDMSSLQILDNRTRLLGSVDDQVISETNKRTSSVWCKHLTQLKVALRGKRLHYTNLETILFILIVLTFINFQTGAVWSCFLQTKYLKHVLGIGRDVNKTDMALTTEALWNHLSGMFLNISSWKKTTFHMIILSAIRVRQIRVQPYKGDCEQDYPDLIEPRCIFSVEDSELETNDYPGTWSDLPLPPGLGKPGPYTYTPAEAFEIYNLKRYFYDISTPLLHYADGGYDAMFSESDINSNAFNELRKKKWVDQYTKAVVVNMNFLNIDSGLSSIVEHIYELTPAGIFMYTTELATFPLKLSQGFEIGQSCLILALSGMTVYFLIFEIKNCYERGPSSYFRSPQSWFLLIERVLSIAVVLKYLLLDSDRKSKLEQIDQAHFIQAQYPIYIDCMKIAEETSTLIVISCLLVIICFIKVLLRFRENFHLEAFVKVIPTVSKLMVLPLMNTTAFAVLGYLLFHSVLKYYWHIKSAVFTVTVMNLQSILISPTLKVTNWIGKVYLAAVYVVSRYLIFNFFIVLLNEAFSELKRMGRLRKKVNS